MKDDINLFDYNVQERVNDFVAAAVSQVNWEIFSPCVRNYFICFPIVPFLFKPFCFGGID
jgi:hypothetical protein